MTLQLIDQPAQTIPVDATQAPPRGLHAVQLRQVSRRFGERSVLQQLDLDIPTGQFVAIVGRSGCGKSTLLRLLAGLDRPDGGSVALPGAGTPDVRVMFQDARLLPWHSVAANVALGLPPAQRSRAAQALAEVGLASRAGQWPTTLSGGEKQRVALARALSHAPRLLLLDEPLGALDALTRIDMQALIERVWADHGFTVLLVTHDVSEAVALADRVLLIEDGRIGLDLTIDLPRPRVRGSAAFSHYEAELLARVLDQPVAPIPEVVRPHNQPSITQLQWAL